jgi:hypothetical protein
MNLSPGLQYKIIVYAENGVSSQSNDQRSAEVLVVTETTGLFVIVAKFRTHFQCGLLTLLSTFFILQFFPVVAIVCMQ